MKAAIGFGVMLAIWGAPATALEIEVDWEAGEARGNLRLEAEPGRLRLEIDQQQPAARDRRDIEALIAENLRAFNREDLDAYMATLAPAAPTYERTREIAAARFAAYDLEATTEAVEVLAVAGDNARVRIVQITRATGKNSDFRDNRLAAVHQLKRVGGRWKFYRMQDIQQLPADRIPS